ncbi:hypothetical protein GWO43_10620 [candidate division KSB1 bacterium]|nr:hypothetical protein [candidate division KSB1 bacterium]NIR69842.1 hypothetical protein [candidate division KSB1 bacterium]NIS24389.1 hypothetical protein [candidate division KSB1 bacterium]NIT71325.1 hypothetical protein [candidate division KSB1 bacterium]NIU27620.1 hypothetical protein [candidate division KSB1 bacterium]
MKELLYFSTSDLMIQVNYRAENNSIHYFSHRKLTVGERVIVEQYLLTNIALKTDYYKKHPAILNYLGINVKLIKDLNQFHLKNTIKALKEKEGEAEDSVRCLINESMTNYYFEQIGSVILELRNSKNGLPEEKRLAYKNQLVELIDAYNVYSERQVAFEEVLSEELLSLIE